MMKPYATYIEVNGDKAYFKDDILIITSSNLTPSLYDSYRDGSTSKYGVTVQEVKEAILKNMKIVFNYMELGVGGAPDRLVGKYFITSIRNSGDVETEEYQLHYNTEDGNDRQITINFGQEPEPGR